MKKRGVIITIVVVVAAVAMIAPRFLRPKEEVAAASLPVVSVEKPRMGSLEIQTGLTGSVEPSDMVYVIPKAAGEVTQVYVKAGDFVQEGQKLLDIDTKQVEGAKINLDTAAVSLQDANTNLQRMTVLYQSGDISRQQFEQIQSSARMAKLQYDGAKLAYDNQIEFSSITAPISGLVESFNVEIHDNVAQSNTLCVISGKGTKAVSFNAGGTPCRGFYHCREKRERIPRRDLRDQLHGGCSHGPFQGKGILRECGQPGDRGAGKALCDLRAGGSGDADSDGRRIL